MNDETRETADMPPAENASAPPPKRETKREKRARLEQEMAELAKAADGTDEPEEIHPTKRPDWVPRAQRLMLQALRVNPRASKVRVLRSWQGVRNGQIVVLHPAEAKRRLKSGMAEVVDAK